MGQQAQHTQRVFGGDRDSRLSNEHRAALLSLLHRYCCAWPCIVAAGDVLSLLCQLSLLCPLRSAWPSIHEVAVGGCTSSKVQVATRPVSPAVRAVPRCAANSRVGGVHEEHGAGRDEADQPGAELAQRAGSDHNWDQHDQEELCRGMKNQKTLKQANSTNVYLVSDASAWGSHEWLPSANHVAQECKALGARTM